MDELFVVGFFVDAEDETEQAADTYTVQPSGLIDAVGS